MPQTPSSLTPARASLATHNALDGREKRVHALAIPCAGAEATLARQHARRYVDLRTACQRATLQAPSWRHDSHRGYGNDTTCRAATTTATAQDTSDTPS